MQEKHTHKEKDREKKSVRLDETIQERLIPAAESTFETEAPGFVPPTRFGNSAQYRRRSSIPFADRTPKVRFNRIETCITSTKPGPHKPIVPGTESEEELMKVIKSIIKETKHPILIDLNLLAFTSPNPSNVLTNDEMLLCTAMVEWQCKSIARADRSGRGALDIISFPTTADRVEAGSRLRGCLMIVIDIMRQLTGELNFEDSETKTKILDEISEDVQEILTLNREMLTIAKKYLAKSKSIFKKWKQLLKKKGEFHIEAVRIKARIYHGGMPESVTLYENVNSSSLHTYEGILTFSWNSKTMIISNDIDNSRIKFSSCTHLEKLQVLSILVKHIRELIRCSIVQLKVALDVFEEPILETGFDNIKSRVVGMQFEKSFDPLCVLDLKNTLGELVQRNSELLNQAEKLIDICLWKTKFLVLFNNFTQQFIQRKDVQNKKLKNSCLPCGSFKIVRFEQLTGQLGRMAHLDILLSMPSPTSFTMPKASVIHGSDGDDVTKAETNDDTTSEGGDSASNSSTIYRLIASSKAELRVHL